MLHLKMYDSIHKVGPQHWDSILNPDDVFHSWHFIKVVEDGGVENSRYRYLLFYKDTELIGSTVLSAFTISLDIFIANSAWVRQVKKWCPRFFNINILICGLPASFGQLNIKVVDKTHADEVCRLIAAEMKKLARVWNIRFLAVKEFLHNHRELGNAFLKEGFFLANSIPYMSMKVSWASFSGYLNSLRHPYRRHMLQSLRKINWEAPVILHSDEYNKDSPEIAWVLSDPAWVGPSLFCDLYLRVMGRTKTKLETLNQGFFDELFAENSHYQLLSLVEGGHLLSSALLVPHGDTLTFMLVARADEKDKYDSYFNLMYGIIAYAIDKRFKKIGLGQTAYWVKQSVGGKPENQYLYFGCTGKLLHLILKKLNPIIFPAIKLNSVKIFKANIHVADSV